MDVVKNFGDESLDFVYIDSNHKYEYCKEDVREWSKKVKRGGLVAGHDYINGVSEDIGGTQTDFGVKRAVDEWVEVNSIEPLFIFDKGKSPTWFYVKQ
jgi:predicted O-methyltransferase YrrM